MFIHIDFQLTYESQLADVLKLWNEHVACSIRIENHVSVHLIYSLPICPPHSRVVLYMQRELGENLQHPRKEPGRDVCRPFISSTEVLVKARQIAEIFPKIQKVQSSFTDSVIIIDRNKAVLLLCEVLTWKPCHHHWSFVSNETFKVCLNGRNEAVNVDYM